MSRMRTNQETDLLKYFRRQGPAVPGSRLYKRPKTLRTGLIGRDKGKVG